MKENEWNSIKDTIMDIKKKREETKRRREGIDVESLLSSLLSEELTKEVDKDIAKKVSKKFLSTSADKNFVRNVLKEYYK